CHPRHIRYRGIRFRHSRGVEWRSRPAPLLPRAVMVVDLPVVAHRTRRCRFDACAVSAPGKTPLTDPEVRSLLPCHVRSPISALLLPYSTSSPAPALPPPRPSGRPRSPSPWPVLPSPAGAAPPPARRTPPASRWSPASPPPRPPAVAARVTPRAA